MTPAMGGKPWSRTSTMGVSLLLVWVFFALVSPEFLSPRNISNLATELSITAILALGMLLVLLCGQIDLSVGSLIALSSVVRAYLIRGFGGAREGSRNRVRPGGSRCPLR